MNIFAIWMVTIISMALIALSLILALYITWLTVSHSSPIPNDILVRLLFFFISTSLEITLIIYVIKFITIYYIRI